MYTAIYVHSFVRKTTRVALYFKISRRRVLHMNDDIINSCMHFCEISQQMRSFYSKLKVCVMLYQSTCHVVGHHSGLNIVI